jgi:hypothetical protein
MPRIRCPECDHTVKIDADDERASVRCDECGFKIRVDDKSVGGRMPIKKKPRFELQSYLRERWLSFLPITILFPIGLLYLVATFFHPPLVILALVHCPIIYLVGLVFAAVAASRENHHVAFDYLEFLGPLRWILAVGFFGLYLIGYAALWSIVVAIAAVAKPKLYFPWIAIMAYALLLPLAALLVTVIGLKAGMMHHVAPPPNFAAQPGQVRPPDFAQQNPRPDPNQGGNPNNPPPEPNKDKEKKPDNQPPARLTGDAELDNALADLEANDFFKRDRAADKLARTQPNEHRPMVAEKLAQLAQGANADTAKVAVRPLATWATAKEVPLLIEFLKDKEKCNLILRNIGKLKDERAAGPVARCLVEFTTRFDAMAALREMGPMAEKETLAMLKHADVDVRADAIRVLKDIGTFQSIPALEAARSEFIVRGTADAAIKAIKARGK